MNGGAEQHFWEILISAEGDFRSVAVTLKKMGSSNPIFTLSVLQIERYTYGVVSQSMIANVPCDELASDPGCTPPPRPTILG